MDHLLRGLAPISQAGWEEIESEASRTLRHFLAGRKLLDYSASGGWQRGAVDLGRIDPVQDGSVRLANRTSAPMTEVRVDFVVSRDELAAVDRGAEDMDTQPVIDAARSAALAEDDAVFVGNSEAGIRGIRQATPHKTIKIDKSLDRFPHSVAKAIDLLADEGIGGPYGIGMGPRCWQGVMESSEAGGYPLLKHLRLLLDGPVVWAPSLSGAVVLSQRGGDYDIVGGQDWAIGYQSHNEETVTLYLEETLAFLINTPEAAVPLDFAD